MAWNLIKYSKLWFLSPWRVHGFPGTDSSFPCLMVHLIFHTTIIISSTFHFQCVFFFVGSQILSSPRSLSIASGLYSSFASLWNWKINFFFIFFFISIFLSRAFRSEKLVPQLSIRVTCTEFRFFSRWHRCPRNWDGRKLRWVREKWNKKWGFDS